MSAAVVDTDRETQRALSELYALCVPAPFPGGRLLASLDLLERVSRQDPETLADIERRYGRGRR
jgi:hypothetical protein